MIEFERLGQIYSPDGEKSWARTHAANPYAEPISNRSAWVYFSPRDARNRSHIGKLKLECVESALNVIDIDPNPVLAPGAADRFDCDGVTMGCVIEHRGEKLLYYIGWRLESEVPFRTQIGCARYRPQTGTFERVSEDPILPRDPIDPHSFSYPWIMKNPDGALTMYYGSASRWKDSTETQFHLLRMARSEDGIVWQKSRDPILSPEGDEIAVVRPAISLTPEGMRMWFCAREANAPYYISSAVSADGVRWKREQKRLTIPSFSGEFDSEMQCYSVPLELSGGSFLLYNGNRYGQTGFGAVRLHPNDYLPHKPA